MASVQSDLHAEASSLTRALYRRCLRSVEVLAAGNVRDEEDFAAREAKELSMFDEDGRIDDGDGGDGGGGGGGGGELSFAPPVDRENELASRANCYRQHAREHFDGHWDLLGKDGFYVGDEGSMRHGLGHAGGAGGGWNQYQGGHHHLGAQMSAQYRGGENAADRARRGGEGDETYYMWREEQIEQFVYLMRSGEEKRRWILSSYEFEDPFNPPEGAADDGGDDAPEGADEGVPRGWSDELEGRLRDFEDRSDALVRGMYRDSNWMHSSDYGCAEEDDGFFSDSDSDGET